jgi:rare lipoprotein A
MSKHRRSGYPLPPARSGRLPVAGLLALLLAACGSTPQREAPPVATPGASSKPAPKKPASVVTKRGGGYYLDDGPADDIPDNLDAIPDAVPRWEPLARAPNRPYVALGKEYIPNTAVVPYQARGIASWYGKKYHGQKTSIGERYDMFSMTAAHPTLAIPSYVRVVNPANGKAVVVRVIDRGPFHADRVIDLSYTAAWKLGIINTGSGLVEVEAIIPGSAASSSYAQVGSPLPARADSKVAPAKVAAAAATAPAAAPAGNGASEAAEERGLLLSPSDRAELAALEGKLKRAEAIAPAAASGVFLQLGAFASADNAESLKSRIGRDLEWLSEPIRIAPGNGLHRVQLGPYASRGDAEKMAEKIRLALGYKPTVVVR